ncbi:MAG: hypothetical protein IKR94_01355 [Bacteroidales bacterium]|nr:hypothetical protein [Bacteroidales bacterium]
MTIHKLLLPVVIALPISAVIFFESCLPDGDDTIIVDTPSKTIDASPEDTISHQPHETIDSAANLVAVDFMPIIHQSIQPDTVSVDVSDLQGKSGDLRFNLQWNTIDDIDLYAVNPCGDTICFYYREALCNGAVGALDVDANYDIFPEHPQENIYWETPSPGEYKIFVHNFSRYIDDSYPDVDYTLTIVNRGKRTDLNGRTNGSAFTLVRIVEVEPY